MTLLLAKVTIVFMPVTLMTGYFSIQFANVQFTVTNYWLTFGVILAVSLVLLFLFSFFSGTFEGKIISKPWTRMLYDVSRRWWVHRRKRTKTY